MCDNAAARAADLSRSEGDRGESDRGEWATASALVKRILDGEGGAEDEFVAKYQRGVRAIVARASRDRSIVDDLSQDVMVLALEKIRAGAVREPARLSGYVAGLARNRVVEYFRRLDARAAADLHVHARSTVPSASPLEQALDRERAAIVRRVLDELRSDRDRQILVRYYLAEDDKAGICRDLSLTSAQFNQVLFRARERVRQLLLARPLRGDVK